MTFPFPDATEVTPLSGGAEHSGFLFTRADGSRVAVKNTPGLAADLFPTEAAGLAALRDSGVIATPRVIEVTPEYLLMEALRPAPPLDHAPFWEEAGRRLAALHARPGERYGFAHDNWLGMVRQFNPWTGDGYEFFARQRILRYLPEPNVMAALDVADRRGIERICERLPSLVPPSYPALTHGDLWHGNILSTVDGTPALIDPAVSWSWPAVDTSMLRWCGSPAPDRMFEAYHEILSPDPDWLDQAELLHLRELLSLLAHDADRPYRSAVVGRVRALVRRYG